MRMSSSGVNVKASEKLATDPVLWQHAAYSVLDQSFRMLCFDHIGSRFFLATIITRVSEDHAISPLLAGHLYLFSINNYNMISTIYMGRIARLMLAADYHGYLTRYAAQNLSFGIYQDPLLVGSSLV